jgi:hypothetical protein
MNETGHRPSRDHRRGDVRSKLTFPSPRARTPAPLSRRNDLGLFPSSGPELGNASITIWLIFQLLVFTDHIHLEMNCSKLHMRSDD